ncbi:uncharacterized protein LOC110024846 [Phalaenopsis equestris]|uniref:uncharacterized protein LOC110024846 n=1 Tax=Phalaenopsis equestris TaxID=78828 RepID=UPI0009E3A17F|nr:uncharacterized protein LOC110024846 [Phalaenopsis equestris]
MSSASIFRSLRELFPQVDLRMLRAISIEHAEDINEAIEFILSEVLPASNATPGVSFILHDTGDNGPEHITIPDGNPDSSFGLQNYNDGAESRGSDSFVAHGTNGCVLGQPYFISDAGSITEPEHEESIYNNSLSLNLNQLSEKEDENFLYKSHNQDGIVESLLHGGRKEIIPTELFIKFTEELECVHMDLHSDTEELVQLRDEENISVQLDEQTISSDVFDKCKNPIEYGFEQQNDINIQLNACNDLSECSSEQCRPLNLHDLETLVTPPVLTRLLSASDFSEKNQHYLGLTTETGKNAMDYDNHNSLSLDVNFLEFSSDENILPVTLATRSGHAVSTDVLEDSIKEAKSSKESLVSSFDSMVSMMREVELFEEKAELAKEEASVAGHHALCKVEELQQIVKKSKDENDMQSGQVYGERSILSTEARELQSRLLRMSEERSKYLSVIEEIAFLVIFA